MTICRGALTKALSARGVWGSISWWVSEGSRRSREDGVGERWAEPCPCEGPKASDWGV